jgi:hypothetical protein
VVITEQRRLEILAYLRSTSRTPVKDKRLRAITVNPAYRWQPKIRIEVGQAYANLEPGSPREEILAIFESASFLVVTESRGAGTGAPYFFSREDVRRVEYFEPEP